VEGTLANLALYRKYRSADFSEVVAQEHVVKTLSNAIAAGKHSHAYLLTGPRGVGKTTVARIIAKQLNGLKKADLISDYLDIIEIDGASNRGIDEIRSLREKVRVSPAKLTYKVYIIDEVHMLTKEAFNALLKTLEEPPGHVVFIFATTEVHKLPETIISRTQRFDFKPIPAAAIAKHLRFIASQEKITIDDPALALIARVSSGGFRDAISLLDQIASAGGKITAETVVEFTGLQDSATIEAIIEARQKSDFSLLLELVQKLVDDGIDASLLTQQILDYIQFSLLSADATKQSFLLTLASDLHWAQTNLRYSSSPALVLQVALTKNSYPSEAKTMADSKTPDLPNVVPTDLFKQAIQPKVASKPSPASKPQTLGSEDLLIKSLSVIKHYNNSLYAVLRGAEIEVADDEIRVKCQFSFHKDRISEPRNTNLVEKAFSKVYGQNMHLITKIDTAKQTATVSSQEELASSALAIFGGEVVDG